MSQIVSWMDGGDISEADLLLVERLAADGNVDKEVIMKILIAKKSIQDKFGSKSALKRKLVVLS